MRKPFLVSMCLAAIAVAATGARASDADPQAVIGASLVDSFVQPKGAFVSVVAPGGPASKAGLLAGDVITAVDGKPVSGTSDLERLLSARRASGKLALKVVHLGKPQQFTLVLAGPTPAPAPTTAVDVTRLAPAQEPPLGTPAHPRVLPVATTAAKPKETGGWVTFTDPAEHAFTIDVPNGWRVTGGTRRMNPVEIRTGIEAVSPDGAIDLFYSDLGIPIFTVPSPMFAMAGLRQGMMYSPGQGVQMQIMPYMSGELFAAQWGAERVARNCAGVTRNGGRARPDSSQAIDMAYAQGGVRTSILAGEASFSCTMRGTPATGYVFAGTELVQSQMSNIWDVKSLAGFTAVAPRSADAYQLLSHMVASFAVDKNWMARQQQTAAQFDRIVAQTNAAVSNAIIENGRALAARSDQIFRDGQARSNANISAIDRYDERAVRGTSSYSNPETGASYSLDNRFAHSYVAPSGEIQQTDSENPPGPGWTELQRSP